MASDREKVRLLITDVDEDDPLFTDEQVDTFLELTDGDVYAAAADALDTIATSEVLVSKVIRTQDLQTDGAKVAAELRARASSLRARSAEAAEVEVFDVTYPARRCAPELTEPPVVWGL